MTPNTIKSTLDAIINGYIGSWGANTTLSQAQLTVITDDLAANGLETVNPNGPGYPSTPK